MASGGATPTPSFTSGTATPPVPVNGITEPHPSNILSITAPLESSSSSTTNGVPKTVICVFCGASPGKSPIHMEAARSLAHAFHAQNISLVYGGGTVGLMGELARTLVSLSGPSSVHGIIPQPLVAHERGPESTSTTTGLPAYETYGRTTVVKDMHTRKRLMASEVFSGGQGSGFIALPGGYGTLEELMEVVTWNQLGIHNRGVVVYNVGSYWDGLLNWVGNAVQAGFVGMGASGIIGAGKDAEECVERLKGYKSVEGRFKLTWGSE